MKNKTLHQAFPIVAAAIGNRFGIKVAVGGHQAYTDGKTIQLPAYDGNDPDYQDFAWGLLAHEAAHIRYSDFTLRVGQSVIRRRLCGAIEDVRIEHELAKDFPGTKLTLRTVVDKMIANGSFVAVSAQDHPANVLYSYVLKRLRASVLGQLSLTPLVELSEAALKAHFPNGAVIRLQGLLSEVPDSLHSESDCLDLADRILVMVEQECEQQAGCHQDAAKSTEDNTATDQTDLANTSQQEDEPELPSTLNEDEAKGSSVNTESVESTGTGNASDENETTEVGNQVDPDKPATAQMSSISELLDALQSAQEEDIAADVFDTLKSALALTAESMSDCVLPVANLPVRDETTGFTLLQKVQSESGKIRAALQGLVQSQSLSRTQHSRRGRLDGKRLYRLTLGDTQVFQHRSVKPAANTAIHCLLDKSESMGYPMSNKDPHAGFRLPVALEATLALALAFEGLPGVNPGITAFPGDQEGSVYPLLAHGQRVRQGAGAFSLKAEGSTPMTEAVWFAAAALLRCREPRKVLLVITDGEPDDRISTLDILQRCRDSGIETIGIGLGLDVSHLFPVAITINDLQELRGQLFELSKALLLAA